MSEGFDLQMEISSPMVVNQREGKANLKRTEENRICSSCCSQFVARLWLILFDQYTEKSKVDSNTNGGSFHELKGQLIVSALEPQLIYVSPIALPESRPYRQCPLALPEQDSVGAQPDAASFAWAHHPCLTLGSCRLGQPGREANQSRCRSSSAFLTISGASQTDLNWSEDV